MDSIVYDMPWGTWPVGSGLWPVARALAWPPLNARQINGNCMQIAQAIHSL